MHLQADISKHLSEQTNFSPFLFLNYSSRIQCLFKIQSNRLTHRLQCKHTLPTPLVGDQIQVTHHLKSSFNKMQKCYSEQKTSGQGYLSSQLTHAKNMCYINAKPNSGQTQKLKQTFEQFLKLSLKYLCIKLAVNYKTHVFSSPSAFCIICYKKTRQLKTEDI